MKKERGSALLTVILITFVTATIGAAVSSFIMMNYRLRALDNKIGRAEYETEKIMDVAYLAVQEGVNTTIIEEKENAVSIVNSRVVPGSDYFLEDGRSVNYDLVKSDTSMEFERLYKQELYSNLKSKINEKIRYTFGITPVNYISGFDHGSSKAIAINFSEEFDDSSNLYKDKLEIYYRLEDTPIIKISAVFVIGIPTFEQADGYDYNLNELVGMTDWEMQDWGYL